MKINLQKPAVFFFPVSIVIALLFIGVLAQPQDATFSYYYPRIEFGEGWKTSVVLVNVGQNASNVRLLAYGAAGTLIKKIAISPAIIAGERRDYSGENGSWPEGTASLKVESDGPLYSYLLLESTDGGSLEAILPVADPATTLTFALMTGEARDWSQLSLLNVGSEQAELQAAALDPSGQILATAQLSSLSGMASANVSVASLFDSAVIGSTAAVQVIANKPLAGVQLFGSDDRKDVEALPGTLVLGQELFLPVFHEAEGVPLWTTAGLFNPRDGPVRVDVEAFDVNHNSLGFLTDPTFLPSHATHLFQTANIGGKLPAETASLKTTADQPIVAFATIGGLKAHGLAAVGALTEADSAAGFELIGSSDGNALTVAPLARMSDGNVQSALTNLGAAHWKRLSIAPQPTARVTFTAAAPNDTPSGADVLTSGVPITGTISPAGDVDWFQITVSGPGTLSVSVTNVPSNIDPVLDVFTSSAAFAASLSTPGNLLHRDVGADGGSESGTATISGSGTYYIRVKDYWGTRSSTSTYRLTATFTPQQSTPSVSLTTRSVSPTTVQVNQPVTVSATILVGNATAEHAGISISFPSLTNLGTSGTSYNSSQGSVSTASVTAGAFNFSYYNPGTTLACSTGSCTSQHLLVEGDWATVGAGSRRALNLTFTPKVVGTHKVKIRAWVTTGGYANVWRDPTSGPTDQQGWSTFEFPVTVTGNQSPTIGTQSQIREDTGAIISPGGTIPEGVGVIFKAPVSDPDGDMVRLEVELRQTSENFTGTPTTETISPYVTSGSTASTPARSGLVPASYKWKARAADNKSPPATSNWGPEGNPDFIVVAAPDLVVTSVSFKPKNVTAGTNQRSGTAGFTTLDVPFTIKNQGGSAAGLFSAEVFLSQNDLITSADRLLGTQNFSSLAVNESKTITMTGLTIPADTPTGNNYRVGIYVDRLNAVIEANDGNNTAVAANSINISDQPWLREVDSTSISGKTPLMLIHGICADAGRWNDLLGNQTFRSTIDGSYKIYRFQYPTSDLGMWACFDVPDIFGAGAPDNSPLPHLPNLYSVGEVLKKRIADLGLWTKGIVIVTHSQGGLVARSYMEQHFHNDVRAGENVLALFTLGTPHHGARYMELPNRTFQATDAPYGDDMVDDANTANPWLRCINGEMVNSGCDNLTPRLAFIPDTGLYFDRIWPYASNSYSNNGGDGIVDLGSSIFSGESMVDRNHERRFVNLGFFGFCGHSDLGRVFNQCVLESDQSRDLFHVLADDLLSVDNASFNYTVTNSGNITVVQGSSGSSTVTATLTSGNSQSVSFQATGLPTGATPSFSSTSCSPTCSTILTISTSASTPAGTYTIAVKGTPLDKTTTFNLKVDPAPPAITDFTPKGGPVGTSVTITGTNFTGASSVKFNGVSAGFTVNSSTQITATVPFGATTGPVSVTTSGGTATSSSNFTVNVPDTTAPVAGSVTPSNTQFGSFVDSPFDLTTSFTDNESTVTSCEYTTDGGTSWNAATVTGSRPNFTCTKTGITGGNGQVLTLNMRATSGGGTGTATAVTRTVDAAAPTTTDNAPAGWVGSDQTVTLTPSDGSGSGVASTQYCTDTTNSCTPATSGTSVLVSCAAGSVCQTYVRYRSTDNVGNVEATKSALVKIDKAAPVVVTELAAPSATKTSVTLTWSNPNDSGSGNASFDVRYRVGSTFAEANWAAASQATGEPVPPTTGMTVGGLVCETTYAFALKTADSVGNISSLSNTAIRTTASCDTTPPLAGSVTPSNNQSGSFVDSPFDLTTSFTDSESDVSSCEYTTNGGTSWSEASVSGSRPNFTCTKTGVTGTDRQVLTVNMRATSGGGTGTATAVTRTVDTAAPTSTDNAPAGWVGSDQTVTLTPSDGSGSGVASTQYCTDTTNSCTPATSGTSVLVSCGAGAVCQTYVRYRSTDRVGNIEATKSALVKIDKAAPTVNITSPTADSTYTTGSSPLSLGGTASDSVGVTEVTWANKRGGSGTPSGTTSWTAGGIVLHTGVNEITVTARDAAGNTGTDTLTVTYSRTFTDDPPTDKPVKAVHITELRQAIDTLRSNCECGLSVFSWNPDPTLTVGVTQVKAEHITDLRNALDAVCLAKTPNPCTSYTDPGTDPSVLVGKVIKKAHIAEIRSNVRDVE